MKNLKKYGCYTLLAVAVFTALWLMCGFVTIEYNINEWGVVKRLWIVSTWLTIVGCTIGCRETT